MNEKSYVSLERKVCLVCARPFDSGAILLDRRLKASMERHTVTGWGLCPEHQKMHEDGYVALVGCDESKTPQGDLVKPGEAYRTGLIAHLRRSVWPSALPGCPVPDGPVCFCPDSVIETLRMMAPEPEKEIP